MMGSSDAEHSSADSLRAILAAFGTEQARQRFLDLCRDYFGERVRGGTRRAEFHNAIMETYSRLRLQMPSEVVPLLTRKEVGNAIMDYFRHEGEEV